MGLSELTLQGCRPHYCHPPRVLNSACAGCGRRTPAPGCGSGNRAGQFVHAYGSREPLRSGIFCGHPGCWARCHILSPLAGATEGHDKRDAINSRGAVVVRSADAISPQAALCDERALSIADDLPCAGADHLIVQPDRAYGCIGAYRTAN